MEIYIGKRVEVSFNNYGTPTRFCDTLKKISKRFLVFSAGFKINLKQVNGIKEDPYGYLFKKLQSK